MPGVGGTRHMNENTRKAVDLGAYLLRKGEPLQKAINAAAKKYDVPRRDVQKGLSSLSGKSQTGNARPRQRLRPLTAEEAAQARQMLDAIRDDPNRFPPAHDDALKLQRIAASLERNGALSRSQIDDLKRIDLSTQYGYNFHW